VLGKDDTTTRLRLSNRLNVDLSELTVRYHYEGGPTKPMPSFAEQKLSLAAGESVDLDVPRTPTGKPVDPTLKRAPRLVGVQLRGKAARVVIDIELPVN
jgi:hypothetical protein